MVPFEGLLKVPSQKGGPGSAWYRGLYHPPFGQNLRLDIQGSQDQDSVAVLLGFGTMVPHVAL